MTSRTDIVGLVGWLFADVLLALSILFLGTTAQGDTVLVPPTSTTTSRSPVTTTTTLPPFDGLNRQPVVVTVAAIDLDALSQPGSPVAIAEADRIEAAVRDQLDDRLDGRHEVGISLTFGVHPTVGRGQLLASAFNDVVAERFPQTFGDTALRTFDYRTEQDRGSVRAELYFLLHHEE